MTHYKNKCCIIMKISPLIIEAPDKLNYNGLGLSHIIKYATNLVYPDKTIYEMLADSAENTNTVALEFMGTKKLSLKN